MFPLQSETALSSLIRSDDLIIEGQAVTNEQFHRVHFDDTIDGAIVYRSKTQRVNALLFSAIQDWKEQGNIVLRHISGVINPPDDFTKPLGWVYFLVMRLDSWVTMAKSLSLFVSNP